VEEEKDMGVERIDTVVIGAGQAGLSSGYHLKRAGRSFVILDANDRVGDSWRLRYDSLLLFTPAWSVSLPGRRYPGSGNSMPTKDQMGDYLESYAEALDLPVRTGVRVERVSREGDRYVVSTADQRFEARNVIVASGANREPRIPVISRELDPSIVQLHSADYRNTSQLRDGEVLVVGVGNSGCDIALEAVGSHPTWLSGPEHGHVPVNIDTLFAKRVVVPAIRFVGLHLLTLRTPFGRAASRKIGSTGVPLVRVKPQQILDAGIQRVPRTVGARGGMPVLEDGRVLDGVTNVIWCTGFRHDLSWIELPMFDEDGAPVHARGAVTSEPGLYLVGLPFQFSAASDALPGVGRDAAYVVKQLVRRSKVEETASVVA
jgi:putative flavoprotein involved in K+ transport